MHGTHLEAATTGVTQTVWKLDRTAQSLYTSICQLLPQFTNLHHGFEPQSVPATELLRTTRVFARTHCPQQYHQVS